MVGDRADAMLEVMDEGMDEGMHEARHEGKYRRIEVVTGRRQRRNWTDEENARNLAESAEPDVKKAILQMSSRSRWRTSSTMRE